MLSGVLQGSVLGPILFLIFINDLPDNIRSSVRLFVDDSVLYSNIYFVQDCLGTPHLVKNTAERFIYFQNSNLHSLA